MANPFGKWRAARVEKPIEEMTAEEVARRDENREKSNYRARRDVRQRVKQLGATHLLTCTTRAVLSRDELLVVWGRFIRLAKRAMQRDLPYVMVLEPHPSNPQHLHIHAAVASFLPARLLRRCWHMALGAPTTMRGAEAPGNVDIKAQSIKGPPGFRRTERIARYLAKYLTKDMERVFNRKAYSSTRMDPLEVRSFWLDAERQHQAVEFACGLLANGANFDAARDMYIGESGRVVWFQYVPYDPGDRDEPPPPF
jgi:hypothetical protein